MTDVNILTERFRQDLFNLTGSNYYVSLKKYKSNELTPDRIIHEVAKYFNISDDEIRTLTRKREYVDKKFICYYFIKEYGHQQSLVSIANLFNLKDHGTVLNGLKKVINYYDTEPTFKNNVDNIRKILLEIQNNTL